jgi:hypothetical protein
MSAPNPYWCHQCRHEIAPTAAFTCGVCGSEFIEQMEPGAVHDDEMDQDSPEEFLPFDMPHLPNMPAPNQQGAAPPPAFRNLFDMLNGLLHQQHAPQQPQPQAAPQLQPQFQFFPMGGANNNFVFHANLGPGQGAAFPNPFGCDFF